MEQSEGEAVAILNHNRPSTYLVPARRYEEMLERLEDAEWMELVRSRKEEKPLAEEVSLDGL